MIKGLPETDPDELRAVLDTLLVISDTHWFHTRLAQELAPGVRPPNDHDLMLERWFATVGVDDVVGAGELSRPAVVTGAGCTAGGQEDRERRVYTRAAEPAICDQGFTARELRLLELSLEEQDEAEA